MATATGNYVCDNSSLANFQSWSGAIFNAFVTTCGWLQTADTGQAANPPAAVPSSAYVYWIFKANDAQAATCPIYVKVEVGYSTTQVGIRITVGTGSNGSGTITNIQSGFNAQVITNNGSNMANQGLTAYPCYFSGDAGEFRMLLWATNPNMGVTESFIIERSKDPSGAKTAEYFTSLYISSGAPSSSLNRHQQTTLASGSTTNFENNIICCLAASNNTGTGAFGGTVAAFPIFPLLGKIGNPILGAMVASASDIGDGATVTVAAMYGGTHTYIACKSVAGCGYQHLGYASTNNNPGALLMRYE